MILFAHDSVSLLLVSPGIIQVALLTHLAVGEPRFPPCGLSSQLAQAHVHRGLRVPMAAKKASPNELMCHWHISFDHVS